MEGIPEPYAVPRALRGLYSWEIQNRATANDPDAKTVVVEIGAIAGEHVRAQGLDSASWPGRPNEEGRATFADERERLWALVDVAATAYLADVDADERAAREHRERSTAALVSVHGVLRGQTADAEARDRTERRRWLIGTAIAIVGLVLAGVAAYTGVRPVGGAETVTVVRTVPTPIP